MNLVLWLLFPELWLVLAQLGFLAGAVMLGIGGFAWVNSRRHREEPGELPELIADQMEPDAPARYRGRRRRRHRGGVRHSRPEEEDSPELVGVLR